MIQRKKTIILIALLIFSSLSISFVLSSDITKIENKSVDFVDESSNSSETLPSFDPMGDEPNDSEAFFYEYFTPPENSFGCGPQIYKTPNWSLFWNKFNTHSAWNLEAQAYNESDVNNFWSLFNSYSEQLLYIYNPGTESWINWTQNLNKNIDKTKLNYSADSDIDFTTTSQGVTSYAYVYRINRPALSTYAIDDTTQHINFTGSNGGLCQLELNYSSVLDNDYSDILDEIIIEKGTNPSNYPYIRIAFMNVTASTLVDCDDIIKSLIREIDYDMHWFSDYGGYDIDSMLNITRHRSPDNSSEKIDLNVTNNAPIDTYFRFKFGIDSRVKEYVNKSNWYEYTLTYDANDTEEFVVFFNWTDVKPLIQNGAILAKHGIKNISGNDVFWFMLTQNTSRQPLKSGNYFEIDPIFGDSTEYVFYKTVGGCSTIVGPREYIVGLEASPASSGRLDNITVRLRNTDEDESLEIKCALFEGTGTSRDLLMDTFTTDIDRGTSFAWYTLDFIDGYEISSGTTYTIVVYGEAPSGATSSLMKGTEVGYQSTGGNTTWFPAINNYPNWEDPLDCSNGKESDSSSECSIYASYTASEPENTDPVNSDPNPPNSSADVGLSLSGYSSHFNITIGDDDVHTMNITWKTNESGTWQTFNTTTNKGNGTYYATNVSWVDTYETTYWWQVCTNDGNGGWDNDTYHFTTMSNPYIPNPPSSFTATADGRFEIDLSWTKGSKADKTYIEYHTASDGSWDIGDHTFLYNDTGETATLDSLDPNTQRFFKAWSWNETGSNYNTTGVTDDATTDSNNVPVNSDPSPSNGAEDVGLSLNNLNDRFSITITDDDGDSMDINWRTNESGSWTTFNTSSSKANGTYYAYNVSWVDELSTKYWWSVNTSDGYGGWDNDTYYFTTASNNAPSITYEEPFNGSVGVCYCITKLNATINDIDGGDTMNWTISTSPDVGFAKSSSPESGGSKVCTLNITLTKGNTYTWYVNVTDGITWTNESYTFTVNTASLFDDSGFACNMELPIEHSDDGGQDFYPMKLHINYSGTDNQPGYIELDNKSKSDFSDIRFSGWNGCELNYWIENYTSENNAIVWVEVDYINSTGNTNITIHYGNNSASNVENIESVRYMNYTNFNQYEIPLDMKENSITSFMCVSHNETIYVYSSGDLGNESLWSSDDNGTSWVYKGTTSIDQGTYEYTDFDVIPGTDDLVFVATANAGATFQLQQWNKTGGFGSVRTKTANDEGRDITISCYNKTCWVIALGARPADPDAPEVVCDITFDSGSIWNNANPSLSFDPDVECAEDFSSLILNNGSVILQWEAEDTDADNPYTAPDKLQGIMGVINNSGSTIDWSNTMEITGGLEGDCEGGGYIQNSTGTLWALYSTSIYNQNNEDKDNANLYKILAREFLGGGDWGDPVIVRGDNSWGGMFTHNFYFMHNDEYCVHPGGIVGHNNYNSNGIYFYKTLNGTPYTNNLSVGGIGSEIECPIGYHRVLMEDGKKCLLSRGFTSGSYEAFSVFNVTDTYNDYMFNCTIKANNTDGEARIGLRCEDYNSFYCLKVNKNGYSTINKVVNDVWTELDNETFPDNWVNGVWYYVDAGIETDGTTAHFMIYYNGTLLHDYNESVETYSEGMVGVTTGASSSNDEVFSDDWMLRKWCYPEPTWGTPGEQSCTGILTLTLPSCEPTSGIASYTIFYFNITWTDLSGNDPADGYLTVNISRVGWNTNQSMSWVSGSNTSGAIYTYSSTLTAGSYNYTFYGYDGTYYNTSGPHINPTVSSQDISFTISTASGGATDIFHFNDWTITTPGLGATTEYNVSEDNQTAVTPACNITNTGNVPLNFSLKWLSNPGAGITLKYSSTNSAPNPGTNSTAVDPSESQIVTNLVTSSTASIWLWMDFVSVLEQSDSAQLRFTSELYT